MKKVIYSREIYSDNTIKNAIEAYKNIATISLKYDKNNAVLVFWKCKYGESLTIGEFENYMIGLENNQ